MGPKKTAYCLNIDGLVVIPAQRWSTETFNVSFYSNRGLVFENKLFQKPLRLWLTCTQICVWKEEKQEQKVSRNVLIERSWIVIRPRHNHLERLLFFTAAAESTGWAALKQPKMYFKWEIINLLVKGEEERLQFKSDGAHKTHKTIENLY